MLKLQNLVVLLRNKSRVEIFLVEQPPSMCRALVTLPRPGVNMLSWHEQATPHPTPHEAFKWAIKHVAHFAKRVETGIDVIDNFGVPEILGGPDQRQIVEAENIPTSIRVNGAYSL